MTFKQLRAAQLRQAMAEREWHNHQQQIRDAQEIERFLTDERTGKITNEAFYGWLRREARGLYSRCFQLAFDTARKAERALQHELGDSNRTFLQYDYLAGREELLAGERLSLDVKRMELAYHELNRREYELTKHVSLRQVNPRALIELRTAGQCTVDLPEELFDLDGPGHYFRRLRSVAVTIPCVVGPYANVNCTLTLLKSTIRTSPSVGEDGYARVGEDTDRFSDYYGGVQAVVTSSGNHDTGLFESSPTDERYLPFENSGAVSQWRLELPADVQQFDFDTISDVVLHLRYQAREGGLALRAASTAALSEKIEAAATVGSTRLLSVRHEFATEWARFSAATVDGENPGAADHHAARGALPVLGAAGRGLRAARGGAVRLGRRRRRDRPPSGARRPARLRAGVHAARRPDGRRAANRLAGRTTAGRDRHVHPVPRRQLDLRPVAGARVGCTRLTGVTEAIVPRARQRGQVTSTSTRCGPTSRSSTAGAGRRTSDP